MKKGRQHRRIKKRKKNVTHLEILWVLGVARESVRQQGSKPDDVGREGCKPKGFLGVQKGEEKVSP